MNRNPATDCVMGVGSITKLTSSKLYRFAVYLVDGDGNEYTEILFANRQGYARQLQQEYAERIITA